MKTFRTLRFRNMDRPLSARIFTPFFTSRPLWQSLTNSCAVPLLRLGRFALFLNSKKISESQLRANRMSRNILYVLLLILSFLRFARFRRRTIFPVILVVVLVPFLRLRYLRTSTDEIFSILCRRLETTFPLPYFCQFPNTLCIYTSLPLRVITSLILNRVLLYYLALEEYPSSMDSWESVLKK